jgi:hypothetical protein
MGLAPKRLGHLHQQLNRLRSEAGLEQATGIGPAAYTGLLAKTAEVSVTDGA